MRSGSETDSRKGVPESAAGEAVVCIDLADQGHEVTDVSWYFGVAQVSCPVKDRDPLAVLLKAALTRRSKSRDAVNLPDRQRRSIARPPPLCLTVRPSASSCVLASWNS